MAAITLIVTEVELAKHLREKLSAQNAGALIKTIDSMPWTIDEIRERGEAVKKADTYGSIGFDKWFLSKRVYSYAEAVAMAEKIIEARAKAMRDLKVDPEEITRAGLSSIREEYQRQYDLAVEKEATAIRLRCKTAVKFMAGLAANELEDLYNFAVAHGAITDDVVIRNHPREILRYKVAVLLPELEQRMKRLK